MYECAWRARVRQRLDGFVRDGQVHVGRLDGTAECYVTVHARDEVACNSENKNKHCGKLDAS